MFDAGLVIDWSARSTPSPKTPVADAIYACGFTQDTVDHPQYFRTRHACFTACTTAIDAALSRGELFFVGFDFSFGYPKGFVPTVTGQADAKSIWQYFKRHVQDGQDNRNNRFAVADQINARLAGVGPFWGCPANQRFDHLPHKGSARCDHGLAEYRATEIASKTAQSSWKLFTTGSVGSQAILGMHYLAQLVDRYGAAAHFWPFDGDIPSCGPAVVIAEIYPSLFSHPSDADLQHRYGDAIFQIKDACQVWRTADHLRQMTPDQWQGLHSGHHISDPQIQAEGWIVGVSCDHAP